VELLVEDGRLIIAPERRVRDGWKEAFAAAGSSKNDGVLLDAGLANAFDHEEWPGELSAPWTGSVWCGNSGRRRPKRRRQSRPFWSRCSRDPIP